MPGTVLAFGETEAVGSNDDAVLQRDAIAHAAKFADDGVGMSEEVIANLCSAINGDEAVKNGVIADDHVFVHETVRANMSVRADFCARCDNGGGMNAGRVCRRLVKEF